ncbi:MAG: PH domain-containing protein [Ilumatobacteraceae bacterium]
MAYPQRLLNPNEEVLSDLHPHWWFFVRQALAVIASLILTMTVASLTDSGGFGSFVRWATVLALVLSLIWFGVRWVAWVTTYFVVTSDRVIFREGVLRRRGVEIPLGRVNNVLFEQSILERIIGAGDLLIESGGESGRQSFSDVRNPDRVQNTIHAAIDSMRND